MQQPTQEEVIERLTDPKVEDPAPASGTETPAEEIHTPSTDTSKEELAKSVEGEDAKKPRKSSTERTAEIRARIAAETKAYHEARRAREAEEAEYHRLRTEREQMAKPAAAEKKAADDPKPEWSKYEADGHDYDKYQDDRDAWNRRQFEREWSERQKTVQAEESQRRKQYEESRFEDAYQSRLDQVIEKHPDFLELVEQNLADVPQNPFVTAVVKGHDKGPDVLYYLAQNRDEALVLSTLQPSRAVREAVRISKSPENLLAYFAQHPGECDRLSRMAPPDALVALGELNAQLKGAKAGSPAETISNAKAPIRPVGGSRTASPKSTDEMDFGPEWIRAENARERERRRLGQTL